MPHKVEALEPDLKNFLREATIAYANGNTMDVDPADGSTHGAMFDSDGFIIVDIWNQSQDKRVYHGTETVTREGDLVWQASYRGIIQPDASPEEIMDMYGQALMQPDPDLPIRGPHVLEGDKFLYAFDSLGGALSVANFAVKDYIYIPETKRRAYEGHIIGGYVNVG